MIVLVEGFDPDAVALAKLLALEGRTVRIAGFGDPPLSAVGPLEAAGATVEPGADLDASPGPADVAYLDVWTPEVAPRVARLRAQGTIVSCLADLVLERHRGPSIGITGTAGKTTTTALVGQVLAEAGIDHAVGRGARAGNLWPTVDLLERPPGAGQLLLLELTSSHLAFMHHSPTIAAVTCFWPDHLELHGGLAAYRAAKEVIVRYQVAGDLVVMNADDDAASFASVTPAIRHAFSLHGPISQGAYLDSGRGVVIAGDGRETALGSIHTGTPHPGNAVAAAAIAAAAGATTAAIARGLARAATPPWRAEQSGSVAGARVVNDGMAATPSKCAAVLRRFPLSSVVLVAGGTADIGAGPVHASPEEQALLDLACDEVARAARLVVLFGDGGEVLAPRLRSRGVVVCATGSLDEAVARAVNAAPGADALVFSPMFPVALEDRARFAALVACPAGKADA